MPLLDVSVVCPWTSKSVLFDSPSQLGLLLRWNSSLSLSWAGRCSRPFLISAGSGPGAQQLNQLSSAQLQNKLLHGFFQIIPFLIPASTLTPIPPTSGHLLQRGGRCCSTSKSRRSWKYSRKWLINFFPPFPTDAHDTTLQVLPCFNPA